MSDVRERKRREKVAINDLLLGVFMTYEIDGGGNTI